MVFWKFSFKIQGGHAHVQVCSMIQRNKKNQKSNSPCYYSTHMWPKLWLELQPLLLCRTSSYLWHSSILDRPEVSADRSYQLEIWFSWHFPQRSSGCWVITISWWHELSVHHVLLNLVICALTLKVTSNDCWQNVCCNCWRLSVRSASILDLVSLPCTAKFLASDNFNDHGAHKIDIQPISQPPFLRKSAKHKTCVSIRF